jgi:hypothetical protein
MPSVLTLNKTASAFCDSSKTQASSNHNDFKPKPYTLRKNPNKNKTLIPKLFNNISLRLFLTELLNIILE